MSDPVEGSLCLLEAEFVEKLWVSSDFRRGKVGDFYGILLKLHEKLFLYYILEEVR
jgi:hypothetical protein